MPLFDIDPAQNPAAPGKLLFGRERDAVLPWQVDSNGVIGWGDGSTAPDVTLSRSAPGTLNIQGIGGITVNGSPISGGGGGLPAAFEPLGGRYSVLPAWGRFGGVNLSLGAGVAVGVAFCVARDATFDRIATDVAVAGGAGGLLRAYLSTAVSATDTRPGALVADYGTIASDDGTGLHQWTGLSQAVSEGTLYVLTIAAQVASCSLRTTETTDPRVTLVAAASITGTIAAGAYTRSGVTGSAPDPWGTPSDEVPVRMAVRWA